MIATVHDPGPLARHGSSERSRRQPLASGVGRVIEIVISVVAIALVALWIKRQGWPTFPDKSATIAYLVAAIAVYLLVSMTLRCVRWHRILVASGIEHKRIDAYSLVVVGYMGNNVLPMRGGEVLRIVLLRRSRIAVWPTVSAPSSRSGCLTRFLW